MEIVQNIQRADEALTKTGPYQTPGIGSIISGINEGILNLAQSQTKGSGRGSGGNSKGAAYDYFAQRTAQANAKNFSGPSDIKTFADETYTTAMTTFGISETEARNLAEMTGFKSYGDIPVNLLKKDAAIQTKLYSNALKAGGAILGANASMDQKYAVGIQSINAAEATLNGLVNISALTPEQQEIYKENGGFKTFEGFIRDSWEARVRDTKRDPNVPIETAFDSFRNATIVELENKGVNSRVAEAIVDSALIYDQYAIYGEKVLEDNGLQFYKDASFKAMDTDQKIIQANIKQQFLTNTYNVKQGEESVNMTGAQLLAVMGEQGSAGSTGAAASLLMAGINNLDLLQQIADTTKSRYSYKNLRLSLSSDGAALATILKDNPVAEKNIGDMRAQADLSLLDSANTEGPANKPFIALQKMNEGYTLKDGRIVEPEVVDGLFNTPEAKSAAIQRMFDAVVQGSNKSTRESMLNPGQGYGLYQVDKNGKLQYYTLVGQRLENAAFKATLGPAGAFVKTDLYRFENHSNRGSVIEAGDVDAVFMRENMPEVERMFDILEKSFGYNRQEMYKDFNNYMIRKTDAGKIYFEQSFDKGLFGGRQVSVEMTPADVSRIQKELASLGEDSGPSLTRSVIQGVEEATTGSVEKSIATTIEAGMNEWGKANFRVIEGASVAKEGNTATVTGEAGDTIVSPVAGVVTYAGPLGTKKDISVVVIEGVDGTLWALQAKGATLKANVNDEVALRDPVAIAGPSGAVTVNRYAYPAEEGKMPQKIALQDSPQPPSRKPEDLGETAELAFVPLTPAEERKKRKIILGPYEGKEEISVE